MRYFVSFVLISCFFPRVVFAEKSKLGFEVIPVVGYERVQKLVPTPHTKDRLVYGGRLTAGFPLIAAEAEYLRSTDTEDFPTDGISTKDTEDKARVGLRSSVALGKMISLVARAGAQAKQVKHEETASSVTTVTTSPIVYHPYAGAGLQARLSPKIAFTAELTTVFYNFPNMNNNDYQMTAGFIVRLP